MQQAYHIYAFAVLFVTAYVTFYALRQIFSSRKIALAGSALYMLAPYHLHNIYIRMAVGEYAAQAFLLLIPAALCLLYGTTPPTKQQARKAWWQLTLAFSMLLQTHLLTLELVTLLCALFCLCNLRRTFTKRVFSVWAAAVGMVAALNAWFLVPLLTLMLSGDYDVMQELNRVDALNLQKWGSSFAGLLGLDAEAQGIGLALFLGTACFLLCILAGKEMTDRERRLGLWSTTLSVLSCFMSTSTFPWNDLLHVPVLGSMLLKIQFPWRCMALAIPALLLATCCALSYLQRRAAAKNMGAMLLAVTLAGVMLFYSGYLPTISEKYLGDASQLIYADDYTNVGWYYDGLYLPMMVLGYVCSVPFFLLTVRTSQKEGQKASLMKYVSVALVCYVGVLVLLLLWGRGDAFTLSILGENGLSLNLYTILFIAFFGIGYGAYYATADMPIPMVADCSDYETYRSGKYIPGIMGTLFSLVDKLVSSLSATVVGIAVSFVGLQSLPTQYDPYTPGMNWVVIVLFCIIPMVAWAATLIAMKGYTLTGAKMKEIQAVNACRRDAVAKGMKLEEAMDKWQTMDQLPAEYRS